MNTDPSVVGHLTQINGRKLKLALLPSSPSSPSDDKDDQFEPLSQLGSHLLIRSGPIQLLGIVKMAWQEADKRFLELLPLGHFDQQGNFSQGVDLYPSLGATAHRISAEFLQKIYAPLRAYGLGLGRHSQHIDLRIFADPNKLFGRHLAILGQSGSGKSWTVASLLQRSVKAMPNAHVVLLDLHGEYGWRDEEEKFHSAFDPNVVSHIDARHLEIPYWLLSFGELIELLIDKKDSNASIQIAFMREALLELRREQNVELGVNNISIDSPVYFSITDLYQKFKQANEQMLEFGKKRGPMYGVFDEFLVQFQAMFNDSRYDFLFKPRRRTHSRHLEHLLRDFVGLGEQKKQITVIDLSGVPHDVRPTISAQIARLAFEFNYWNPRRREFPLLLVCEEAHQYIPREDNDRYATTRREIERIAKEGRKYGVGLWVVSQRPMELSETVLSQCANFLCLRLTNPDDQAYVRRLMPEGEQDLTDILAALRRGEALAIGEALPMSTRVRLVPPKPQPISSDVRFDQAWRNGPDDLNVSMIVKRWWLQKR